MSEGFLYSWQDAGAPVLTGSLGSFINVLQKVLVDGYGSKPGLGWTRVFSATNKAVYQNEGTETLVRFDHTVEAGKVYFRGYESMINIDAGLSPCPPLSYATNYILLNASNIQPSNVVPWRILGDSKGIWILVNPNYANAGGYTTAIATGTYKLYYIGDYIPFDFANIHYNFCTMQGAVFTATNDDWKFSTVPNINTHYWGMRGENMFPAAVNIGLSSGSQYEVTAFGYSPDISYFGSPIQATSVPALHSITGIMGRLPGLKNSLSKGNNRGVNLANYAEMQAVKPEMVFDMGDYKEHFWLTYPWSNNVGYVVLTEGKGFRNAI